MSSELTSSKLGAEMSATAQQEGPSQPNDNHAWDHTAQEARVVRKLDLNLMTLFFVLCKLLNCVDFFYRQALTTTPT